MGQMRQAFSTLWGQLLLVKTLFMQQSCFKHRKSTKQEMQRSAQNYMPQKSVCMKFRQKSQLNTPEATRSLHKIDRDEIRCGSSLCIISSRIHNKSQQGTLRATNHHVFAQLHLSKKPNKPPIVMSYLQTQPYPGHTRHYLATSCSIGGVESKKVAIVCFPPYQKYKGNKKDKNQLLKGSWEFKLLASDRLGSRCKFSFQYTV